ncbi:MAG: acyl-CoA dehydrogenase family protein [Planctomycetes bacterium]|nr:acyl-CoA dehydrogenase family protein [Planctomycetota bacterium]
MGSLGLYPFQVPEKVERLLATTRILGRQYLRPLGLEADRQGHAHPPDHPLYAMLAQAGYMERRLAQEAPEEEDGDAGRERWGARSAIAALEEASYWDRGMAVSLPGPGLGGPPVAQLGTPEQRGRFLSIFRDRSRPRWGAFGMTEAGAGSDVARIATRCERRGDRWVLRGEKTFCSNSPRADWIVVYATVDPALGRAGHRAFVVPRETPGLGPFKVERKMGLVAYETASFPLADCEVPAENLLGGEAAYSGNAGFVSAMKTFDLSRAAIAAMALGIGRSALDHASAFAAEAFDLARPLNRHRRVAERLATMGRRLDAGRLLCWKAAWLVDRRMPNSLEASMAKAWCAQAALETTSLAMEVLGEAGVVRDERVEKLFRDVKAMDLVEGTGQIQRLVIARRTLDYPRDEGVGR